MNLHSIRFSFVFVGFLRFCFLKNYALFHPNFYKSISALSRLLYIEKNFVHERYERYFKIELYPFTKTFFRKTLVQYVTVWLVRIWTYENADEKSHSFSWRSINVKKRTKTDEKRILRTIAYAGFSKGGGPGNSENLSLMKTRIKIFQPKTKFVYLPKLRSSLKFSPLFDQKKVFAHRFCAQTFCPGYKEGGHATILNTILC